MPGEGESAPSIATRRLAGQAESARVACTQYALIGKYAETGPPQFVQHVALLCGDGVISAREEVDVFHMGPPLVANTESQTASSNGRRCRADIIGDLVLDAEEREAIDDWLSEVDTEDRNHPLKPFEQYTVIPHVVWKTAPETGRRIRRKFSCAGFVMEAYRRAQIDLLDNNGNIPDIDEEILHAAYSDLFRIERAAPRVREKLGFKGREQFGLHGGGPWKIILAGYLFHSTARATNETPRPAAHLPKSAEEGSFPIPASPDK